MFGFFTLSNFAGIFYWIVPMTVFMTSVYIVAFSRESFAGLIFISVMSLHPLVALPIASLLACLKDTTRRFLESCGYFWYFNVQSSFQQFLKSLFNFNMMTYLGSVSLVQLYLFVSWINRRKVLIANGFGTVVKTNFEFTNEPFNQCKVNATSNEDSSNEILNLLARVDQYDKAWILFSCGVFFFLFHTIESLVAMVREPYSRSLVNFLLGQLAESEDTNHHEDGIDLEVFGRNSEEENGHKYTSEDENHEVAEVRDMIPNDASEVENAGLDEMEKIESEENGHTECLGHSLEDEHLEVTEMIATSTVSPQVNSDQIDCQINDLLNIEQDLAITPPLKDENVQTVNDGCKWNSKKVLKVMTYTLAITFIVLVMICPQTFHFFMHQLQVDNGNSKNLVITKHLM